jgi:hypothetical protein
MGSAAGARAGEEAEEDAAEADGAWAPRPWGVQHQPPGGGEVEGDEVGGGELGKRPGSG